MKTYGEAGVKFHAFLSLALDRCELSASSPGHITPPVTAPCTQWIGGWVGPRAGLATAAVKRKILVTTPAGNWTPIVQSSHYTDWTTLAPTITSILNKNASEDI